MNSGATPVWYVSDSWHCCNQTSSFVLQQSLPRAHSNTMLTIIKLKNVLIKMLRPSRQSAPTGQASAGATQGSKGLNNGVTPVCSVSDCKLR